MYESKDLSQWMHSTVDVYAISKDSAMPIRMSKTYGQFVFHLPK